MNGKVRHVAVSHLLLPSIPMRSVARSHKTCPWLLFLGLLSTRCICQCLSYDCYSYSAFAVAFGAGMPPSQSSLTAFSPLQTWHGVCGLPHLTLCFPTFPFLPLTYTAPPLPLPIFCLLPASLPLCYPSSYPTMHAAACHHGGMDRRKKDWWGR